MGERVEWVVKCPTGEQCVVANEASARWLARDFDADTGSPCYGKGQHKVESRTITEEPTDV